MFKRLNPIDNILSATFLFSLSLKRKKKIKIFFYKNVILLKGIKPFLCNVSIFHLQNYSNCY